MCAVHLEDERTVIFAVCTHFLPRLVGRMFGQYITSLLDTFVFQAVGVRAISFAILNANASISAGLRSCKRATQ